MADKKNKGQEEIKNTSNNTNKDTQEDKQKQDLFEDYGDDDTDETSIIKQQISNLKNILNKVMEFVHHDKSKLKTKTKEPEFKTEDIVRIILQSVNNPIAKSITDMTPLTADEINKDSSAEIISAEDISTNLTILSTNHPSLIETLPDPPKDKNLHDTLETIVLAQQKYIKDRFEFTNITNNKTIIINYLAALALVEYVNPKWNITVYPSITIMQAIVESGWLNKKNVTMFGQKAVHTKLPYDVHETKCTRLVLAVKTHEYINGVNKELTDDFAYAANDYESVQNYARMLQRYTQTLAKPTKEPDTTIYRLGKLNDLYTTIKKPIVGGNIIKNSYVDRILKKFNTNNTVDSGDGDYIKMIKDFDHMTKKQIYDHVKKYGSKDHIKELLKAKIIKKVESTLKPETRYKENKHCHYDSDGKLIKVT